MIFHSNSPWPGRDAELTSLWESGLGRNAIARKMGLRPGQIAGRAMTLNLHCTTVRGIVVAKGSPADRAARTLHKSQVRYVDGSSTMLKGGRDQRKIGARVTKGDWRGYRVFTLTLEERATCPRSCAQWLNCFVPGTKVLLPDMSWVPIEYLLVGDSVCAFDETPEAGKHRRTKLATVEASGRAIQPCYRLVTSRGEVTVSSGHLWLSRGVVDTVRSCSGYTWRATCELAEGDSIPFFVEPWRQDLGYEAGRLRGFVEGEGTALATKNSTALVKKGFSHNVLAWAQKPSALLAEINAIARGLGFGVAEYARVAGAAHTAIVHSEILGGWRETVRFLGIIRPSRLIGAAPVMYGNHSITGGNSDAAVVLAVEPVGEREVVTLKTSANTMVAEGFFTHNCYGNNMGLARRWRWDPLAEFKLWEELAYHQKWNPGGFVVRLHILGDFPSVRAVKFWRKALETFPALRIFGYSAWPHTSPIGNAVKNLRDTQWDRFAIRTSGASSGPRTVVIEREAEAPAGAIVCPVQTGATRSCSTCSLCWSPAAREKTVAFLRH